MCKLPSFGGLYRLNLILSPRHAAAATSIVPITLWHRRLGHLNLRSIRELTARADITIATSPTDTSAFDSICLPCLQGKKKKEISHLPQERASRLLEFIHSDLSGPHDTSFADNKYFVVFIDDFSRWTRVYFLPTKTKKELHGA